MASLRVLCGPVIGLVTSDAAIVLLEIDRQQTVTMTLRPKHGNGEDVTSCVELPERQPRVFTFSGLRPNTKYDVSVPGCDVTGRVRTLPRDPQRINVAVMSCDFPERKAEGGVDMWRKFYQNRNRVDHVHVILHIGDNVYMDGEASDKLSNRELIRDDCGIFDAAKVDQDLAYVRARRLLRGLTGRQEWERHRREILEIYRQRYRHTWGLKYRARVLRTFSNLMILDDHEIRDDFGLLEEDGDQDSKEFWLGTLAVQVYHEYQRQLWDPAILTPEKQSSLFNESYTVQIGPLGVHMMDVRTPNSVYKPRRQPHDDSYYGNEQMETFRESVLDKHGRVRMWLVGCALPLLFFKQIVNKALIELCKKQDDLKAFALRGKSDLEPIWRTIRAWKDRVGSAGDVLLLAGDVHVGGFTDIFVKDAVGDHQPLLCRQVTTSPIHNVHWSRVQFGVGKFTLENFEDKMDEIGLKYRHYDWINQCNFAVVRLDFRQQTRVSYDVILVPERGRPILKTSREISWDRPSVGGALRRMFCFR